VDRLGRWLVTTGIVTSIPTVQAADGVGVARSRQTSRGRLVGCSGRMAMDGYLAKQIYLFYSYKVCIVDDVLTNA
jgi:hypothetical protein